MCSPRNTNFGMDCSYIGLHSSCLEGTKNLKLLEVWDFLPLWRNVEEGHRLRGQTLSCELL